MSRNILHALLALAFAVSVYAQTDIDTTILVGRIVPPEPSVPAPPSPAIRALNEKWAAAEVTPAAPVRPQLILAAAYTTKDSADVTQLTAGAVWEMKRPVRATFTYGSIEPAGSDDSVKSYGGTIRWKIAATDTSGLTLLGAYSDNQGSTKKTQIGATSEFFVGGDVTAGVNARWVRAEKGATEVDDVLVTGTAALNLTTVIVGIGYTLRNDISHEDDISAEIQIPTTIGAFSVFIGKHQTLVFSWAKKFTRK